MKHQDVMLSSEEFTFHIKGCALNKRDSQKKIYTSFYSKAFEICSYYANTNEEAIEILNKGFLKVFKQIAFFSSTCTNQLSSFQGWLLKIIIDETINYYGKNNKRHRMVELRNKIIDSSELIKNRIEQLLPVTNQ